MTKQVQFLVFLIGTLFIINPEGDTQEIINKKPVAGPHEFVPISGINLPMIHTKFTTYVGGGQTSNFFLPVFELPNGRVVGLKGDILFVDAGVTYHQRVRDWLGVYLKYRVAARLGTNVQTVIAQGYNSISSFEIGWKFKIFEGEHSYLSATLEMQNHKGNFVDIYGYIVDVINQHPFPSISDNVPVITGGVGLQYAFGFGELLGVSLQSEIDYGETYTRGENGIRFMSSLAVDVNFHDKFDIPIGLAVATIFTSQQEVVYVDGRVAKMALWKIAYTGAQDFNVGLEWSLMKSPMPSVTNEPTVSTIALSSRFYF